jgi:Xaa-Pro aminopeptidase/Xaa-Pro dipeptidase
MFAAEVYQQRRSRLMAGETHGLMLFLGNVDSPMNYPKNAYPFIQDSSFRYFFELNEPCLAGILDCEQQTVTLFGNELDMDDIVWTGPLPSLAERAEQIGISQVRPYAELEAVLRDALLKGVDVHYLPPYRGETVLELARLLGRTADAVKRGFSEALAHKVVALREIKSSEEVAEIERSLEVTREMHIAAMKSSRPGTVEREVVGVMEGIMRRKDWQLAYPTIFSRRGEVLHNHRHDQVLKAGDLVVNDSGVTSDAGYASDITRAIPVGGKFSERQRALYDTVLAMQLNAIAAMKPGVTYRDVHKLAARTMVERMSEMGFFKGDAAQIVECGAYAIAFPHGLGHMIGMDVHDMENLGEDRVGYGEDITRSELFGLGYLRMAKALKPGMVVTVEPGVYFIPELIDAWQREEKFTDMINYAKFREYADFGGIRIEDNVLITDTGSKILGQPIPKTVEEVERTMAEAI